MTVDQNIASRLRAAREAAGYPSASKAAEALGMKSAAYLHHENGTRGLSRGSDIRYAKFFRVRLEWLLTGVGVMKAGGEPGEYNATLNPPPNAEPATVTALPRPNQMPLDVPVYGVAVGGDAGDFSLNGDVVDRVRRPPGLIGNRSAFAVYVRGDSMEPRHYQGDLLYVDPIRPARSGDDVLVELRPGRPGEPGPAYIKQLVTQGPVRVVLRQFNPAKDITLPGDKILRVSKILKLADLLGI